MKPFIKIALFAVFFIALAGILAALIMFNKRHPDTSKIKPDYVISASDLQRDFESNEKEASARYINKIIEVSGIIASVTPADSAHTNISLKTGNDMSSIICTFAKKAGNDSVRSGSELTVRGECSGFLMDVLLNNCSIVEKRK